MDLQVEEVLAARDLIASARVLLCQLEVPQHVSLAALEIARTHGGALDNCCTLFLRSKLFDFRFSLYHVFYMQ